MQSKKAAKEELTRKLLEMIRSGKSLYEAASDLAIRSDVASDLLEKGLRQEQKRKLQEQTEKIITLHEEGKSGEVISGLLNISGKEVQEVIDKSEYMKRIHNTDSFFEAVKKQNTDVQYHQSLLKDYREGLSIAELSDRYAFKQRMVRGILKRMGIVVVKSLKNSNGGKTRKNEESNRKMAERYRAGASREEIAVEFEVNISRVYKALNENGINDFNERVARNKKISNDFRDGMEVPALMHKYNLSEEAVRKALYKEGINPKMYRVEEFNNKIVEAWRKGKSAEEIAKEYNRTTDRVRIILKSKDIRLRKVYQQKVKNFHQQVKELYQLGNSREQIAKITGRSIHALKKIFIKIGINELKDQNEKIRKRIAELYKQGVRISEIAEEVGYSPGSVGGILTRLKIPHSKEVKRRERNSAIADAYKNGKSAEQIAVQFGIRRSWVLANLRSWGISFKEDQQKQKREKAIQLAEEGVRPVEIAKRLKISKGTVGDYLREKGMNWRNLQNSKRNNQIAEAWRSGKTYEQIQAEFKLSNAAVRQALHKNGIYPIKEWKYKRYEKIVSLYKQGLSKEEIKAEMNLSEDVIQKALRKKKINTFQDRQEKKKSRIVELYKTGKSIDEIGRETGLRHRASIEDALRRSGISIKKDKMEATKQRNNQVKELYLKGLEKEEIARRMNLTASIIKDALWKMGVSQREMITEKLKRRNEQVVLLFRLGKTQEELKKLFGITDRKIREIFSTYHVRPVKTAWAERDKQVIDYYLRPEVKPRDVLKKFNITHSHLYSILGRYNVSIRKVPKKKSAA